MCDSDDKDMCFHCYNLICNKIEHTPYEYFSDPEEKYVRILMWQVEELVNHYLKPKIKYEYNIEKYRSLLWHKSDFKYTWFYEWEIKKIIKWWRGENGQIWPLIAISILVRLKIIPNDNYVVI